MLCRLIIFTGGFVEKKLIYLAESMVQHYLDFHISRASAGLSYFFMLSVFPLLICLYAMLGSMFPTAEELEGLLRGFMPGETVNTLMDFLGYVSDNSSARMLSVAVVAMTTSSAAGFRIVDKVMFELRRTKRKEKLFAFIFSFGFSLVFLSALYLAAVLMATGSWFIGYVDRYVVFLNISRNWEWFRFVVLFLLLFVLILGAYKITSPPGRELILVPGAFMAAIAMVGISMLFSWFIGLSVKYPLVYGSLASVMIMLLWLYICGNVLFLGNIFNISLEKMSSAHRH